ncbi:MAG TPA: hypothetical protein VMT32_18285, partial [Bryobacteraceae bacterium]|nr:hypothetical protein [Bryobacteraceae bacterium]
MDTDPKSVNALIKSRIQGHFDSETPEEIVRRSQQLMLYPEHSVHDIAPPPSTGPVLIHARPKRIPLNAYLASALTGLDSVQKALVVHL